MNYETVDIATLALFGTTWPTPAFFGKAQKLNLIAPLISWRIGIRFVHFNVTFHALRSQVAHNAEHFFVAARSFLPLICFVVSRVTRAFVYLEHFDQRENIRAFSA